VSLAAEPPRPVVHLGAAAESAALPVEYSGIVTRGIAFAIDALVIQVVAIAVAGTGALILSVISLPNDVKTVIAAVGGVSYVLWLVGYFIVFWSTTGQTPGNRLLEIRVCREADGGPVRPATALLRFVALVLAAVPLFAGFLPIMLDDRRRGVHDMIARTVVVPDAGNNA
jgi:uncharacterized RDD family membrane protein YckC